MEPTVSSHGVQPKADRNEVRQRFLGGLARTSGRLMDKGMQWLLLRIRQWEKRPLDQRKREVIGGMAVLIGLLGLQVYLTLHPGEQESSLERLYEGVRQHWQSMPQNRSESPSINR